MKKTLCVILWLVLIGVAFAGPQLGGGKSGGGTSSSGNVATDSIWTAKGQVAAGTGVGTAAVLSAATDYSIQYTLTSEATGLKYLTPVANAVLGYDSNGKLGAYTSISPKFTEVDGHTNGTALSAANVSRTFINSYGRTGAVTLTLPTAAEGYSFVAIAGTQHNSLWAFQVTSGDSIYWDSAGVITSAQTNFGETNQAVGSRVSCSTFRTGASAYSWLCGVVSGTWTTNNL